jgi:hypothetical protein
MQREADPSPNHDSLAEVSAGQCPLLQGQGADRDALEAMCQWFNGVRRQLLRLEQELPALHDQEGLREIRAGLRAVRGKMTRRTYLVGYCGPSQIGKTTALSNVLGVSEAEAPGKSGSSKATSCAILRLHPVTQGRHRLALHYMTSEQFQQLRDRLVAAAGFHGNFDDDELRTRMIPARRKEIDEGKVQGKDNDLNMLQRLLESRHLHGGKLQKPALEVANLPYEQRTEYINHGPEKEPARDNLLLDYVEIGFRTDRLPKELEMIDLPGLGQTDRDTALTQRFLGELDCALIFYLASSVGHGTGEELFSLLRLVFEGRQNLAGRVWLVLTYMDSLTAPQWYGSEQERLKTTLLHSLKETLSQHGLDPNQVIFLSKKVYDAFKETGGRVNPDEARRMCGLRAGEAAPPALRELPEFRPAFDDLLKDGGIGRLYDVIAHKLPPDIREQTRRWCAGKLARVSADLANCVTSLRRQVESDGRWMQDVSTGLLRLVEVIGQTAQRQPEFEAEAGALNGLLQELFAKTMFSDNPTTDAVGVDTLKTLFPIHAKALQARFDVEGDKLVGRLYGLLKQHFSGLPAVEVLQHPDLASAWAAFAAADQRDPSWREACQFPSFHSDQLFAGLDIERYSTPLNGRTYREMMREKIRLSSQQAVHAVRVRLRLRLDELQAAMRKLAQSQMTSKVPAGPAGRLLQEVSRELESLGGLRA